MKDVINKAQTLDLKKKYELALIGADFIVQENEGYSVKNSYFYEYYLLKALAVEYLALCEEKDFDYESINALNIINKLRCIGGGAGDKPTVKKAREVLRDYSTFKGMLNTEIHNELNKRNDLFARMDKEMKLNTTPEMLESIQQIKAEIENASNIDKEEN